jgi:hypothetical protein
MNADVLATSVVAESAEPFRVIEETPAYWRVIFDYPPFNVVDATMFQGLQDLLAGMDVSPGLRVKAIPCAPWLGGAVTPRSMPRMHVKFKVGSFPLRPTLATGRGSRLLAIMRPASRQSRGCE